MKLKNIVSLFILAASVLVTGCEKEKIVYEYIENPDDPQGGDSDDDIKDDGNLVYMTFSAAAPPIVDSKSRTQIGEGGKVFWQKGDQISVFNIEESSPINYKFTTEDEDGSSSAAFTGYTTPSSNDKYLALYPYNSMAKVTKITAGNVVTYQVRSFVNSEQVAPSTGGYDPKACHSIAKFVKDKDGNYNGEFKLLGSMMAFEFSENSSNPLKSQLDKIKISLKDQTSNGHWHVGGNYIVKLKDGAVEDVVAEFEYQQAHEVVLKADGDGFKYDGTEYLVALPAMNPAPDLIATLFLKDGRKFRHTFTGEELILNRGSLQPVSTLTLSDDMFVDKVTLNIESKDAFLTWYQSTDIDAYDEVILKANIDLEGVSGLVSRAYNGVFDGNNYSISNMTVSNTSGGLAGFIGNMTTGEIKNLTLNNFTATGFFQTCGSIVGSISNGTVISNCKVNGFTVNGGNSIGGLVGKADRSEIVACEVYDVKANYSQSIGGLVGNLINGNTVKASYAYGTINYYTYGGGVVGVANINNTITSCYSTIEVKSGPSFGGIYGYADGALSINSSYYAGSTNTDGMITKDELKGKMSEMNTAIADTGYEYVTNTNGDTSAQLPLVIQKKATGQ